MDKKSLLIGTTLLALALLWPFLVASIWQRSYRPTNTPQDPPSTTAAQSSVIPSIQEQSSLNDTETHSALFHQTPSIASLENDLMKIDFSIVGTGIRSATLKTHESENNQRIVLNQNGAAPLLGISGWDDGSTSIHNIRAQKSDNAVRFSYTSPMGLEIIKTFQLPPEKRTYQTLASITIKNPLQQAVTIPSFLLNVGTAEPIHDTDAPYYIGSDYGGPDGVRHKKLTDFHPGFFGMRPQRKIIEEMRPLRWVTSRNQYFLTLLRCENENFEGFRAVAVKFPPRTDGVRREGVQSFAKMPSVSLPPGGTITWNFLLYTGPREYSQLKALGERAQDIMEYGWFALVSVFLNWLMNVYHGWVGSYGLAIILMVLTVRAALWPLQSKANKTMKQMQALAPHLQQLQQKYKDNPQKLNEEILTLYNEYGVNPLGGCLPILVQIPIFFGFYTMLQSAVQLRYERFFWVRDLSQPDTIFVIPILDFPINLLPILMGATSLWQISITPMTTADKFQATLYKIMPLIFVIICYNFSSALALYWTVQNLIGVFQLYYNMNKPLPELKKRQKPKSRWQLLAEQARQMAELERKKKIERKK